MGANGIEGGGEDGLAVFDGEIDEVGLYEVSHVTLASREWEIISYRNRPPEESPPRIWQAHYPMAL